MKQDHTYHRLFQYKNTTTELVRYH